MLDVFHGFKNIIKITRLHTDGSVFRLHYQVTVVILIAFSIVVTTRQYVGNPIECNHSKDVTEAVINTYCWISSTHTVLTAYDANEIGFDNKYPYPGVGHTKFEKERKYHKYYQWVCFMLFFQAILFYIPRWLWKNWEGGKIQALMMDLHISICTDAEKRQKKKLLLDYLWCNLRNHNWWASRYFFCEFLCFVNVVGQIFLVDVFLDGEFLTYGIQVLEFMETDQTDRTDPMVYVFPRVTKCHFHKIGSSGTVERHDAICILPLNVVNEKIYIFLWFWFIILAGLTGLVLLYRLVIILVPRVRVMLLQVRFGLIPKEQLEKLVSKSQIGDWFLFYMLGQNVDMLIFKDVIGELTGCVDKDALEPTVWPFGYGHSLYVDFRATY